MCGLLDTLLQLASCLGRRPAWFRDWYQRDAPDRKLRAAAGPITCEENSSFTSPEDPCLP
jgi:hypothetical protein